jgi:hypothetical protein
MKSKYICNNSFLIIGLFLLCFSYNDKKTEKTNSKEFIFLNFEPGITYDEYHRVAKSDSLLSKCDSVMLEYCYYYKLKSSLLLSYVMPHFNDSTKLLEGIFLHNVTLKRSEINELIKWHVERYHQPTFLTEFHSDSVKCMKWKLDHKEIKICIDSFEYYDGRNYSFEIYHDIIPN